MDIQRVTTFLLINKGIILIIYKDNIWLPDVKGQILTPSFIVGYFLNRGYCFQCVTHIFAFPRTKYSSQCRVTYVVTGGLTKGYAWIPVRNLSYFNNRCLKTRYHKMNSVFCYKMSYSPWEPLG